jgi:hypothetical protein
VRLADGDTVALWGVGDATLPGRGRGVLVDFQPVSGLTDTAYLRHTAVELFRTLDASFLGEPAFVALRTVTRDSHRRSLSTGGLAFVVEKRIDGYWYLVGDTVKISSAGGKGPK